MGNIELMVKLQVFTYIHDQRVVHRQFTPDTQYSGLFGLKSYPPRWAIWAEPGRKSVSLFCSLIRSL